MSGCGRVDELGVDESKTPRCSRKKDGCEWEGELRHLDHHEREECVWALVECRYHCGERVPRRQLAEHEEDVCPQRPLGGRQTGELHEERHMREITQKGNGGERADDGKEAS